MIKISYFLLIDKLKFKKGSWSPVTGIKIPVKKIQSNKNFTKISKVLNILREQYNYKISLKYNSNKIIKFKILKFKRLPYWKPINSDINNLIKFLIN